MSAAENARRLKTACTECNFDRHQPAGGCTETLFKNICVKWVFKHDTNILNDVKRYNTQKTLQVECIIKT